jgi:hypothetical protein
LALSIPDKYYARTKFTHALSASTVTYAVCISTIRTGMVPGSGAAMSRSRRIRLQAER